jgi:hypothetical protein
MRPEPYKVQGCHAPYVVHGGMRNLRRWVGDSVKGRRGDDEVFELNELNKLNKLK